MEAIGKGIVGAACSVALVACTVITGDVDQLRIGASAVTGDGGGAGDAQSALVDESSFRLVLKSMSPHPGQYTELRIADAQNNLVFRGVLDPMGASDVSVFIRRALPPAGRPFRLDLYADQNGSRSYDGIGSVVTNDHAWRREPLEVGAPDIAVAAGVTTLTFVHDTRFTDIDTFPTGGSKNRVRDTGVDAAFTLTGMAEFVGKLAQLTVSDPTSGRTLGIYRLPKIPSATPRVAKLAGIVEPGVSYNVDLYIDANGDGKYQDPVTIPDADRGWRIVQTAEIGGLTATFDPASARTPFDVGAPD